MKKTQRKPEDLNPYPALTKMALRFFDEAVDATGDDRHAAMMATAALMAAIDRLQASRRRGADPVQKTTP